MRCLRFHRCIQTTCSLSCVPLTSCLFHPICCPSICRQVPTQHGLFIIRAACSAGIHTGSWLEFVLKCQCSRHKWTKSKAWCHVDAELATTFWGDPLHRVHLTHLLIDLDGAVAGSDLFLRCLHRKNLAACSSKIANGWCKPLPKSTCHFLFKSGNWEVAIVALPDLHDVKDFTTKGALQNHIEMVQSKYSV